MRRRKGENLLLPRRSEERNGRGASLWLLRSVQGRSLVAAFKRKGEKRKKRKATYPSVTTENPKTVWLRRPGGEADPSCAEKKERKGLSPPTKGEDVSSGASLPDFPYGKGKEKEGGLSCVSPKGWLVPLRERRESRATGGIKLSLGERGKIRVQ